MNKSLISAAVISVMGLYGQVHAADTDLDIGGVVEVEITENSIAASTVELGLSKQVNDMVSAEMSLLYEGATTDIDVAAITISPKGAGWNIKTGQFYVPFGSFESNMISDPLTLGMAETRANALQLGYEKSGFGVSAYVASGLTSLDTNGYHVSYSYESDSVNFGLDLGMTNDLGNSSGIQGLANVPTDQVIGQSLSTRIEGAGVSLIYETILSDAAFTTGDLTGLQPTATNIELAYNFKLGGKDTNIALASQTSEQASGLLAQSRYMFAFSNEVMKGTSLGIEYMQETDYASAITTAITAKLAVEF